LPPVWKSSQTLRFLIANRFNFDKALKTIQEYIEWQKWKLPVTLSPGVASLLDSGIMYIHGRDNRYRPLIVLNSHMIDLKKIDLEVFLDTITYQLEYLIKHFMLPGQVENWVFINNLNSMGLTSLPLTTLKKVMDYFQNNYRGRLYKMYVLNTPFSLNMIWSMVKTFMEETTVNKIHFHKTNTCEEMWTHINKDQVEKRFGGNAPDTKDKFWPPMFPSENYTTPGEKKEDILVNKHTYYIMHRGGKLAGHIVNKKIITEIHESGATVGSDKSKKLGDMDYID